jgi:hypothetical protein
MNIKQITIEGRNGDVAIVRIHDGAIVVVNHEIVCELKCKDDQETRYAKARQATRHIHGECRDRRTRELVPNATNSMIHDVLREIERVAHC